jgi:dipeptidyl aminopeptidase/acylaminoacyl peptidase
VETLSVPSDGVLIRGWLYLPKQPANARYPVIVLTNGGGDGSRPIKSLSDWIAPVLAHCGIAALVHDKRGTGESGGRFVETTYDDYVTDAGNLAVFLTRHPRINPKLIGVLGGSEGGRVAVLTASHYPAVTFVVSFAGTVVSPQEDRIYAHMGGFRSRGIPDSVIAEVEPLWRRSFAAWASDQPADHAKVNAEIAEARERFSRDVLPFPKAEMEAIPDFAAVLPTWRSLGRDYMTEMQRFNKPWLAMFGEVDQVVPTEASVRNIQRLMARSRNTRYTIAVIPRCGHAPVDVETRRMIRLDHLILNWLTDHVLRG